MAARRWRIAIGVAAAAGIALALAAGTACRDIPQLACNSGGLRAATSTDECGSCVEDRCCDLVGRCSGDLGCKARFGKAQACVIDAGVHASRQELGCLVDAGIAVDAGGTDLQAYSCMRASCGAACSLPVCNVDPAAKQILGAACDQCITGACCQEINDCYQDRICKLQLECLTTNCGDAFKKLLAGAPTAVPGMGIGVNGTTQFALATCKGEDASVPLVDDDIRCLQEECFSVYKEDTLQLDPSKTASCLGAKFFACAASSQCGAICAAEARDAATDASGPGDAGDAGDAADAGDAD